MLAGNSSQNKSKRKGEVLDRSDTTVEQYPSTFASKNTNYGDTEQDFLDQIVTLAGTLRTKLLFSIAAWEGGDDIHGNLQCRPEVAEMLMRATPHPERADYYAHLFAKRCLELYKPSKDRSGQLQAGPLQQIIKHPTYVDILAKCIREPFIAHMGYFDEIEFCLWIVTETIFHPPADDEEKVEVQELDDSNYEFSLKFLKRFPFAGTKQLIHHTNAWRSLRGEDPIVQTQEMELAEIHTNKMQRIAFEAKAQQSANILRIG